DIHAGPVDDFLQIDAAVNQGNSGGPSFNMAGEVIGINAAIASPNGGSVGIGFAIPSNLAKPVIEALRAHGTVERGWLGVQIQEVMPEIASALGLAAPSGALVTSVAPDGPAADAGIRQGDVVLSFAGEEVASARALPRLVAATKEGSAVDLIVWRDRAKVALKAEVGRLPAEVAQRGDGGSEADQSSPSVKALGAKLASLTPEVRARFGIPVGMSGVAVVALDPRGPAAAHGLRIGDIIEAVGTTPVTDPAAVAAALDRAEQDEAVLLRVNRNGDSRYIGVKLGLA
ncbi:MAG: PDZ domain-containing protein, partial [Alphaproteobacteria bacterium]|nr:PDZ domain-containing protein [Alphaproteobacteria bacterium]